MWAFWRKERQDLVAYRTGTDLGVRAGLAGDMNHTAAAELVSGSGVGQ